jgi:uncharacterized protein YjbI with pentapeptide repeats
MEFSMEEANAIHQNTKRDLNALAVAAQEEIIQATKYLRITSVIFVRILRSQKPGSLRNENLENIALVGVSLDHLSFEGADLQSVLLSGTAKGANLGNCDLRGANLAGLSLFGASFRDSVLSSARFPRDLGVYFLDTSRPDFTGADWWDAENGEYAFEDPQSNHPDIAELERYYPKKAQEKRFAQVHRSLLVPAD